MSDPISQPAPSTAASPPEHSRRSPAKTNWWAELRSIFWLLLAVWAFWSLVAKPFYIPSESMMPTLLKGDRLVVSRYPYGWSFASLTFHPLPFIRGRLFGHLPERGDVVIVVPPGMRTDYIKRVIGLPGDRLELRRGALWLNGAPVARERMPDAMIAMDPNTRGLAFPDDRPSDPRFAAHIVTSATGKQFYRLPIWRETLPSGARYDTIVMDPDSMGENFGPITVPAGHVFLMGDNRDNSADSRFPVEEEGLGGAVPLENLGGRAEFITFSLDGSSSWLNPLSWLQALRGGGRTGTSLRPESAPS